MARKEVVKIGLILPVVGAAGLAVEHVQKKESIGATAEEAIPVVNHVVASPRVFLMGAPIDGTDELATIGAAENFPCADGIRDIPFGMCAIAFVAAARSALTVIERSLSKQWKRKGHSGRCVGEKT